MDWEVVKISGDIKGRGTPYASVGFGRLSLNAAACQLVKNIAQYPYVEMLQGKKSGKLCIGIRLLKERTENSLAITRGKEGNGRKNEFVINSKAVLEELFKINGVQKKVTRYTVLKDPDAENILMIVGV